MSDTAQVMDSFETVLSNGSNRSHFCKKMDPMKNESRQIWNALTWDEPKVNHHNINTTTDKVVSAPCKLDSQGPHSLVDDINQRIEQAMKDIDETKRNIDKKMPPSPTKSIPVNKQPESTNQTQNEVSTSDITSSSSSTTTACGTTHSAPCPPVKEFVKEEIEKSEERIKEYIQTLKKKKAPSKKPNYMRTYKKKTPDTGTNPSSSTTSTNEKKKSVKKTTTKVAEKKIKKENKATTAPVTKQKSKKSPSTKKAVHFETKKKQKTSSSSSSIKNKNISSRINQGTPSKHSLKPEIFEPKSVSALQELIHKHHLESMKKRAEIQEAYDMKRIKELEEKQSRDVSNTSVSLLTGQPPFSLYGNQSHSQPSCDDRTVMLSFNSRIVTHTDMDKENVHESVVHSVDARQDELKKSGFTPRARKKTKRTHVHIPRPQTAQPSIRKKRTNSTPSWGAGPGVQQGRDQMQMKSARSRRRKQKEEKVPIQVGQFIGLFNEQKNKSSSSSSPIMRNDSSMNQWTVWKQQREELPSSMFYK